MLLNILHHHFIGHIARTGRKVASSPKVPPPKLTAQRLELHQHPPRRPSLDGLEQITDRNVRRYRYEDVNVVPGDMPLENLNVFGLTNFTHQLPQPRSYLACKNRLAVFGDPDQMILAFPARVTYDSHQPPMEAPLVREFERFTTWETSLFFGTVKLRESPGRAASLPK